MISSFVGLDFRNPNPGCQRLYGFKNITEEICVRSAVEGCAVQRKRQLGVNQRRWRRCAGQ